MSYLLNLLGINFGVDVACYEDVDAIVSVGECKKAVQNCGLESAEDVDAIARNLASVKGLFLDVAKDIVADSKKTGLSEHEAKIKVKNFFDDMLEKVGSDYKLVFFIVQSLIEHYAQYLGDSKIDLDSVPHYYSKHVEAYKNPSEYEVKVYTFNKSIKKEQEELKEFMHGISNKALSSDVEEKFSEKCRPTVINSLFVTDKSVVGNFYEAVELLEVGQISEPVFQNLGEHEMVFFIVLDKKTTIPVVSKEDQVKRVIVACRFIANQMIHEKIEKLLVEKKIVE